jgi:hypothetical protein
LLVRTAARFVLVLSAWPLARMQNVCHPPDTWWCPSCCFLINAAGSVLVFLPNWQAIVDVFELLMEDPSLAGGLQLYVLHSLLPMQEQQEAFTHAAPGGAVG